MSQRLRLIVSLLMFAGLSATSATTSTASQQSLSLTAGVSSVYNNNFLEYSNNQLDRFKAGTNPLRFAIESTDDAIFSPAVSLQWELDQGGGRRHALRAHWDGDFHGTNPSADYRSYSARWTESFGGGKRLAVGYGRMDNFYVRQLRDEDIARVLVAPVNRDLAFQRAEFDQDAITATWRQNVAKNMNMGLAYRYEKRDYVPAFAERSSKANQGEIRLGWDGLPKGAELELNAGYRQSKAEPQLGDSSDVSYHGILAGATGRMQLSRSKMMRWTGDAGIDLATRSYDSDLGAVIDPFHFERSDMLIGFEVGVRASYKRWDARAFGRIENNNADLGTGAAPTSDSGSYNKNMVGLELSWSGDLWKSGKSN